VVDKRVERMSKRFALALERGTAKRAKWASNEVVAQRYREGVERGFGEIARVRAVLVDLGVSPQYFARYIPFGQALARICRDYEMATRENLVRGLIREWEMRLGWTGVTPNPPDRTVLLAICERGFGVKLGQWVRVEFENQPKAEGRS
jgi:hypothetical protein